MTLTTSSSKTIVGPTNDESWGSLKSLEKVLASKIAPGDSRTIVGPLFGLNKLRAADAHLPSGDLEVSMTLVGVDTGSPFVVQGYQMLHAVVTALQEIRKTIEDCW